MVIKKNLPNIITLSRLAFTVVFVLFVYAVLYCNSINPQYFVSNAYIVICFFTIILSDIMDGHVARKMKLSTVFGAKLDLIVDLIYVIGTVGIFVCFDKLPAWFIIVLLCSYIQFLVTSKLLTRRVRTQPHIVFDKIGKTAANMTMLLPGVFVFRCMSVDYVLIMGMSAFLITSLFLASSVYRVSLVIKYFRAADE